MLDNIKQEIENIKSNKDFSIPISNYTNVIGSLKPITYYDLGNDIIIENLMNWRNNNINAYLSHEKATFEGTRRWLAKFVLDNPNKFLFIVYTEGHKPIGHMGLADGLETNIFIEMDNIVRGVNAEVKGIMSIALYDLISWVFVLSGCSKVYLRVFSDNDRAIRMYKRLMFVEKEKYALEKINTSGIVKYEIIENAKASNKYFSYMELNKCDHYGNYKKFKNWEI